MILQNLKRLIAATLVTGLAFSGSVSAQVADEAISLNFRNADIRSVIEAVGEITGKTFVIDPVVKGTVTIISTEPVSINVVYNALLAALKQRRLTAVEDGALIKIIPEKRANFEGGPVYAGPSGETGDKVITRLFPLKFAYSTTLLPIIRALVSPDNLVLDYPGYNTLVVIEYAGNIERIERLVNSMDKPSVGEVEIIPLNHISVFDFVDLFKQVYPYGSGANALPGSGSGKGVTGAGSRFTITPVSRNNSLVLRYDDRIIKDQILDLVRKVDIPTPAGSVSVIKLKNADPGEVAKILSGLTLDNISAKKDDKAPATKQGVGSNTVIQADVSTHSLIISATDEVYNIIRPLIEKLDAPRKQVFVEALIAEITAEKVAEFGIQWQSLRGFDVNRGGPTGIGSANLGVSDSGSISSVATTAASGIDLGSGVNIGVTNGTLTLPSGAVVPNLLMLAHALEADAKANILSIPTLLTLDDEEAKITVGQNVPFVTGQYQTDQSASTTSTDTTGGTTTTASVTPFQTIDREDVGITLQIRPRVTSDTTVRINIYQEVSSLVPTTVDTGASDVVTNKRALQTTVTVESGQIIALGGLVEDKVVMSKERVPILGHIPILGALFSYEKRQNTKTNLIIFLRPYILDDPGEVDNVTRGRYDYMLGVQREETVEDNLFLPDMPSPKSPELQLRKTPGKEAITPDKGVEESKIEK